ncbi:MAG: hypothetical protein ACODAD_12290 [Planctomycetota bacterium]
MTYQQYGDMIGGKLPETRLVPCRNIFQAVGFLRVESCPTPAVLPLVGLPAEKVIRDRDN